MLFGAEFLYSLTLDSPIADWQFPHCQVPLDTVPRYMHLVKIGVLTENEVCERLYGCIIVDDDTRSTEEIDAVYHHALQEGIFIPKHELPDEEQHPEQKHQRRSFSWIKRRKETAQPKTDPPEEYGKE